MTTEEFKRGMRAMNDLLPDCLSAVVLVMRPDKEVRVTTVGEPEDIRDLVGKFADYLTLRGGIK